jgi:hypothetical protein
MCNKLGSVLGTQTELHTERPFFYHTFFTPGCVETFGGEFLLQVHPEWVC